jgi:anti-sigma-K factor RskA
MRAGRPHTHTLAGAYAMDALDGREAARFERHMARCQECAREVAGLREATASLAAAAAVRPAAGLRQRVMATAARTRQLPPAEGRRSWLTRPRLTRPRLTRPWPRWDTRPAAGGRGRRWWRPLVPRVALAMAGLVLVTAVAVWAGAAAGGHRAGGHRAGGGQTQVAEVLTAADATMLSANASNGGHVTVVMSAHERMLVFAAAGLRGLPASHCYELWLIGRAGDRPAGLLPMPRHGMTGPQVASGLQPGDRLGLSVEPAGGSPRPTTPMIIDLTL